MKIHDKLIMKPVTALTRYENNSRTHSKGQVKQIADSINEFGFTNPILIDENNTLVAGHGRLEASKLLDLKEVPCIVLEGLTDAQRKSYVIADNQLALNAGWDIDLLGTEVEDLLNMDFDIDILGFDKSTLIDLGLTDGVELPEIPKGDKSPFSQRTYTLHTTQVDIVDEAIRKAVGLVEDETENTNKNGNALYLICYLFLKDNPTEVVKNHGKA